MLPINPIRKILEQNCPYHIREGAIWELKKFLEDIACRISSGAVKEFEKLNKRREKLGLSHLKRLNAWAVKEAYSNVLKQLTDVEMGLQSNGLASPGGNKMSVQTNATKPKLTTDDRNREVV